MSEFILIIFFLYFFAILSWRNLVWGIAIIAGLLPLYLWRFQIGFLPMTVLEGMVLILFILWLVKKITPLAPLLRGVNAGWLWPIAAWLVVATMAVFISPNTRAAFGIWKAYFIESILFFAVFISVIKTRKDLRLVFYALGASALYIGALAIYQKFTGYLIPNANWFNPVTRRVTAFYGYPNAIGLYLAPLAVLFFGLAVQKIKELIKPRSLSAAPLTKRRDTVIVIFFLVSCFLSLAAIVFAVSEGAIVGVIAGLVIFGLMVRKLRLPTAILVALALILIFSQPALKDIVWEKITLRDFSGQLRLGMWRETGEMLAQNSLFGAGLAGYQQAVAPFHKKEYIEIYLYPHNLFLNFWSELGLLGLVVFLWIIIKFFWQGFKEFLKAKQTGQRCRDCLLLASIMAAMIAMLVHGLVDVPYFKNDLAILFWLLIGSLIVLEKVDKLER